MQGFVAVFKHHLKLDPLPQLNQRDSCGGRASYRVNEERVH